MNRRRLALPAIALLVLAAFVALAISVNAERVGPGERRSAAAATASCSSCA